MTTTSGDGRCPRLRKFHSATVQVIDLERAIDFYCNTLGFEPCDREHPPDVIPLQSDGIPLHLSRVDHSAPKHIGAHILLAIETHNIVKMMAALKAKGVQFLDDEPREFLGALLADFRDPTGNVLRLVQPRRLRILERPEPDQLPRLYLKERDIAILIKLFHYRVLSSQQIHRLLFAPDTPGGAIYGKLKGGQRRLRQLWLHGYVFRDEVPTKISAGKLPLIYTLDHKGVRLLADRLKLEPREVAKRSNPKLVGASSPFLSHLQRTNDIRIDITQATQQLGWKIVQWVDDYDLHRGYDKVSLSINPKDPESKKRQVAIIPDAYFWLQADTRHFHHFIECDLRNLPGEYTEPGRKDWARRVRAYIEYYRSGMYHRRYHAGKSLRILTVTTSEARLMTLKEITERVAGKFKQRFLYTTFERLTPETALTGEIWKVAGRDGLDSLIW